MTYIEATATSEATIKLGINGNYYVYSKSKEAVKEVCDNIGKAESSIYFREEYQVWVARIKSKQHINKLLILQRGV